MNEKLKSIALECYRPYGNFDHEKFAQLIVKECARIAAQTPCPYIDETMRSQLGHTWDMACVASARTIRDHFELDK